MSAATQSVASKDGTPIACDRRGDGPAVVLVAGAAQHRATDRQGRRLAERLSARFAVWSYDRRGRGESGDTLPYAVAREVEDLLAVVAAAGGRASLVGFSAGAVLAIEAAAAEPGAVARLALYEPPLDPGRSPRPREAAAEAPPPRPGGGGARERAMGTATLLLRIVGAWARRPTLGQARSLGRTLRYDWQVIGAALAGGRLPARWARAAMPALVIDGAGSWPWVGRAADWTAGALPEARRLTLPGQTHDADADALAPHLAAFLAP